MGNLGDHVRGGERQNGEGGSQGRVFSGSLPRVLHKAKHGLSAYGLLCTCTVYLTLQPLALCVYIQVFMHMLDFTLILGGAIITGN